MEQNYLYENDDGKSEFVMDVLTDVHNGWVKDNEKKFMARDKKHQHMPIELIGWEEVKSDLLFAQPILETMGIELSEEKLEEIYNKRVKKFFLEKDIQTSGDLADYIENGENFYSALEGQEEILKALKDEKFVRETIIPQIEEKGIGSVKEVREKLIIKDFINNGIEEMRERDFNYVTTEECTKIEGVLNRENQQLEQRYKELKEKDEIIRRIQEKIEHKKDLQEKIEQLEQEQAEKKDQNQYYYDE